jgi:hypothetical protein
MIYLSVNNYGFVRRARFCYLYTQSGTRLTDLCQAGGRAILGWNCGSANTAFKNVFNRGVHWVTDTMPGTEEAQRLERAVRALFSNEQCHVSLVHTDDVCETNSRRLLSPLPQWRPWSVDPTVTDRLYFLPPFPLASDWAITLSEKPLSPTQSLPPSCILAGITRSIYDLIAELPKRGEPGWARYDKCLTPFWERRGPYLYPKMSEADYPAFVDRCLDAHLVISPHYGVPSIIPWGANPGDFTLLSRMTHGNC